MEKRTNSLRKATPENNKKSYSKDNKRVSSYGNVKKRDKKENPLSNEKAEEKKYLATKENTTYTKPSKNSKKYDDAVGEEAERRIYNKEKSSGYKGKEKSASGSYFDRPKPKFKKLDFDKNTKTIDDDSIRLNKFIANAGVCSRREADEMIAAGVVTVNGIVVTELGTKVKRTDNVNYGGEGLKLEKNVYLLLNKPKDFITTMDDPEERKTVMHLVKNACKERIFPVGRLDRNTTGLLLFTNDGDLAKKLTHPKHGLKKIYHVMLNADVAKEHLETLKKGVELEDGYAKVDEIEYVGTGVDRKQVGVELHIGRNRIVRRMFEHFGYKVKTLDRVYFAGLTKKDLPRGRYRFLESEEVRMLKMLG
jgi:23S rRNA pseudouridine2605 synthase